MCADLLGLKEVHIGGILAHVELPEAVDALSDAVHGLIGLDTQVSKK